MTDTTAPDRQASRTTLLPSSLRLPSAKSPPCNHRLIDQADLALPASRASVATDASSPITGPSPGSTRHDGHTRGGPRVRGRKGAVPRAQVGEERSARSTHTGSSATSLPPDRTSATSRQSRPQALVETARREVRHHRQADAQTGVVPVEQPGRAPRKPGTTPLPRDSIDTSRLAPGESLPSSPSPEAQNNRKLMRFATAFLPQFVPTTEPPERSVHDPHSDVRPGGIVTVRRVCDQPMFAGDLPAT